MGDINNVDEVVEEIATHISTEVSGVKLYAVPAKACRNVCAEKECDYTYGKGIRQSVEYQKHISNVRRFMMQVNEILMQADEKAAAGNSGE